MSNENLLEDEINQLLWAGKVAEATRVLDKASLNVKAEISDAQEVINALRQKESSINQLQAARSGNNLIDPQSEEAKTKRNKKVIEFAKEIAIHGKVETSELAIKLESENIDLGVADNRKSTVISNILFRTGNFERIKKGLYCVPD